MAASISLHQPVESLAIVISFLKNKKSKEISNFIPILALSFYTFSALLGCFLSLFITSYVSIETLTLIESMVVAFTAGTFLYVSTAEVSLSSLSPLTHSTHANFSPFSFLGARRRGGEQQLQDPDDLLPLLHHRHRLHPLSGASLRLGLRSKLTEYFKTLRTHAKTALNKREGETDKREEGKI